VREIQSPFTVSGFRLGHWTHPDAATGCTVLLADQISPAAADVRGGAPGTRETELLNAHCMARRLDAVLLTGGSTFGLAAADGVMSWLRERGRGVSTPVIPVPLVAGAVVYDLAGSDPPYPGPDAGYEATDTANHQWESGRHGAGAGVTVSKALGRHGAIPAGIGVSQVATPSGTVSAVFVVNAVGDIVDDRTGQPITTPGSGGRTSEEIMLTQEFTGGFGENTVIGAVVCDRPMSHHALTRMTIAGHSGLARVVRPSHTPHDGDSIFALASEEGPVSRTELIQLTSAAQLVSARAIVNAVR
jgi:L-aminopeptidase/D-esterase-like protein